MPVKMHTPLLALTLALGLSGSVALADVAPDAETLRTELSRTEKELGEVRAAARQLAVKNQQLEDVASERGRALTVTQAELSAKAAALPMNATPSRCNSPRPAPPPLRRRPPSRN